MNVNVFQIRNLIYELIDIECIAMRNDPYRWIITWLLTKGIYSITLT